MNLSDDNFFTKMINDIESSDELTDDDKDLLRKLAKKVVEMEDES